MDRIKDNEATVLVVEDNAVDALFIQKALKNSKIVEDVTIAIDGRKALDYLQRIEDATIKTRETLPKLIILDLRMPHMDGFEFLHHLRSFPKFKVIPVVIFSGSSDEHDKKMALNLGADSFYTKPLSIDSFITTIEEIGKFWLQPNSIEGSR
ncbi:MAG: response regulator [Bacteroidota bacterium]